jgi:FkbM family methyltransferase
MDFNLARIVSRARKLGRPLKKAYRQVRPRTAVSIGERKYALPIAPADFLRLDVDHEPWLNWVYAAALEMKHGALVDVGVNRGQTLAKMLRIAPNNRYIGFEPQPACAFYVGEFLRINRLDNCTIVPIALSDHAGLSVLALNTFDPGDGAASIAKGYRPDSFYVQSMTIPIFRGDDIFSTFSESISLLKIDVEGAELEVLRGLTSTHGERRPFVLFEVLNNYLVVTGEYLSDELAAHRNEQARQISSFFADAGYAVFNIREKALIRSDVIRPEVSGDLSITNYLAVPNELVPGLERFIHQPVTRNRSG